MQIVWLKRDLRIRDNSAITAINPKAPATLLYVFEPSIIANNDSDIRHWRFIWQSLQCINNWLISKKLPSVTICYGNIIDVLTEINTKHNIKCLISNQETGNLATYERDKLVSSWCKTNNLPWQQFENNGVIRGRNARKDWVKNWYTYVSAPQNNVTEAQLKTLEQINIDKKFSIPDNFLLQLQQENTLMQKGGFDYGEKYLQSFFKDRCHNYAKNISKPLLARTSCSRLSPYIAYGNFSVRQIYQVTELQKNNNSSIKRQLNFFLERLCWQAHFIQKLESSYKIEFENMNSGFNELNKTLDNDKLIAWQLGKTGFPLIDASMLCVQQTGYLNFRMRAMVVSFLTHHLWQPWQAGAAFLAKCFLDYEPGIHYAQFQMQAGTTGINTIRIYNPVKQSHDHDVDGYFIKKWLPQLANLPTKFIHQPWLLTEAEQIMYQCNIGVDYPYPIIELETAAKYAREHLWKQKKSVAVKTNNQQVLDLFTQRKQETE